MGYGDEYSREEDKICPICNKTKVSDHDLFLWKGKCIWCNIKELDERRARIEVDSAIESGEGMSDNQIICPHCGDAITDDIWEYAPEDSHEIKCEKCDLKFKLNIEVTYTYKTSKLEEKDD